MASGDSCLNSSVLFRDERFKKLQEWYPKTHPTILMARLNRFRNEEMSSEERAQEWYPTDDFKVAFTAFMHTENRRAKIEKARKKKGDNVRAKNFEAALAAYNNAQLNDAVQRIVFDFNEVVEHYKSGFKNNAKKTVNGLGGFMSIMDKLFDSYKKVTVDELYQGLLGEAPKDITEGKKAELKQYASRVAFELNTMADFKEYLIVRSAGIIGETLGIRPDYDAVVAEWKKSIDNDINNTDDEQGKKDEGFAKNARYVDVRMKRIIDTISAKAKNIISNIPMLNDKGEVVKTIFGIPRYMDYRQVAYSLYKIVENARPSNFMQTLLDASSDYPWARFLYDELRRGGKFKQAVIYTNFKKVRNRYYSIFKNNNKKYQIGFANSSAKNSAVVRHMSVNMTGGNSLNSQYQIYDANGDIRNDLDYAAIKTDIGRITSLLDGVEMRKGKNPVDAYGASNGKREEYYGLTGEASADSFISSHKEDLDKLAEYARGVGINIIGDDLEHAIKFDMPGKGDVSQYHNRVAVLARALDTVYGQAKSGNYETGDDLMLAIKIAAARINFSLAQLFYDEAEDRVLIGDKNIGALQDTNVIHIVGDILKNAEGKSDEAYRNEIMEEFGQYEGFSYKGKLIGWIKEYYENPSIAKGLEVINLINFRNVPFSELNDDQRKIAPFVAWLGEDRSVYELPMQGDYEHRYEFFRHQYGDGRGYIKVGNEANEEQRKVYNSTIVPLYHKEIRENGEVVEFFNRNSPIVDAFLDEVMAEMEVWDAIEARQAAGYKTLSIYEKNSKKFNVFPSFNDIGFREKYNSLDSALARDKYAREEICRALQANADLDMQTFAYSNIKEGLLSDMFNKAGELTASSRARLLEFSANSYYARLQTTRIFAGGYAHYPSIFEFEKRSGFMGAPHSHLYSDGNRNVLVIDDDVTASAFLNDIIVIAEKLYGDKMISENEKRAMITAFSNIKSTDGQGFSIDDTYVETLEVLGEWDADKQAAYERIKNGKMKDGDSELFSTETLKLVGAGFRGIPAAPLEGQRPVRCPFFHKYSEIPLMSEEFAKYNPRYGSAFISGLYDAVKRLEKEKGIKINSVLFKSDSKIGVSNILHPLAIENGKRVYNTKKKISDYIFNEVSAAPDKFIQTVSLKYYGKAANLPKYNIDDRITTSAQAEKSTFTDIQDETTEEIRQKQMGHIGDMEISAQEAWKAHDAIEVAEIIDAYNEVRVLIKDKKRLESIFQSELASKGYSSREVMHALSLLDNGEFAAHLFLPSFSKDVQSLLFSLISQRMTRRKSKGAHIAQYTSVGIDQSSAPWNDDYLTKDDMLGLRFRENKKTGNKEFKGIESYVPMWDSNFEIFADENGSISPSRLAWLVENGYIDGRALEFEGYRTPSDHIHSVLPLIAKGITSLAGGGGIAMAKEAMKLTGHDYDGDEMHCHFQETELVWDDEFLEKLFKRINARDQRSENKILYDDEMTLEQFLEKIKKNKGKNSITKALNSAKIEWLKAVSIKVIEYDFKESPMADVNKSEASRNNAKLSLRRSVLTSDFGFRRLFIPGINDATDVFAKSILICRMLGENKLTVGGLKKAADSNNITSIDFTNAGTLYESLAKLSAEDIDILADAVSGNVNPYSYTYSIDAYKRVIGGASMIEVFALYSSAFQMLEHADLYYKDMVTEKGYRMHVGFFGKQFGNLYSTMIKDRSGAYLGLSSLFMSRMVQTAVDNPKNPLIGIINQTKQLSPIMNFLAAAGLGEEEIHLVFNQPVMIELGKRLSVKGNSGFIGECEDIIHHLDKNARAAGTSSYDIKLYKSLENIIGSGKSMYIDGLFTPFNEMQKRSHSFIQFQCDLLRTLSHLVEPAKDLSDAVRSTRPESSTGTVGPNIANTGIKYERLSNLREKAIKGESRIGNLERLVGSQNITGAETDNEIFDAITKNSSIGHVAAHNSLMYDNVFSWLKTYFPEAKESWISLAINIAKQYSYPSLKEGILRQILSEMLTWKILRNDNYIGDIKERRDDLVNHLHERVRALRSEASIARNVIKKGGVPTNEMAASLIDNEFLKKLGTRKKRITFNPGSVINSDNRDKFSDGWAEMMNSKYPEVRQMAIDLYEYNILVNGMRFGMYEFAHFAPMSVIYSIPRFKGTLDSVLRSDFTRADEDTVNFCYYYYMNHANDDALVPTLSADKLPNTLREKFGYNTIDTLMYEHKSDIPWTYDIDYIRSKFCINIDNVTPNGHDVGTYLVSVAKNGAVTFNRVPVFSKVGSKGQIEIYYNPQVSYKDYINKDVVKHKSSPLEGGLRSQPEAGYDYTADSDNGKYDKDNGPLSRGPRGLRPSSQPDTDASDNGPAVGVDNSAPVGQPRNNSPLDMGPRGPRGAVTKEKVDAVKDIHEKVKEADDKNEEAIKSMEASGARVNMYTKGDISTEDSRDITNFNYNDYVSSLANDDYEQIDELPEAGDNLSSDNREFYIGKKDGSDVAVLKAPIKPWSFRLAKKQRAYRKLFDYLSGMFNQMGIPISALYEAEARMDGVYGLTDFDKLKVVAEELKDVIRLSKDEYEAMVALPEEAAHLALAMLGDNNVLVNRLINNLMTNENALVEAFEGQYEEYSDLYKDDKRKLATEAAGKLVAKAMLREQEIRDSGVRSLVRRVVDAIKEFLRKLNIRVINNMILDSEDVAGQLARDLLSGELVNEMDIENVKETGILYKKAKEDITKWDDSVSKLLKIEERRLKMLNSRIVNRNKKNDTNNASIDFVKNEIESLKNDIMKHKTESAIISYFGYATEFLEKTKQNLIALENNGYSANVICKQLDIIRDTVDGFMLAIHTINKDIENGLIDNTANLQSSISKIRQFCSELTESTDRIGMVYFRKLASNFYGDNGITVEVGKDKGTHYSIDDMTTVAPKDITLYSRWINSLANASDLILKAIDGTVKTAKQKARAETDMYQKRINVAFANLKRITGSDDQRFMFEYKRDKNTGKLVKTGKFISAKDAESLTDTQRAFYNEIIAIKKELCKYLPEAFVEEKMAIVMMRKTALEKARSDKSVKGKLKHLWHAAKDTIMDTSDDIDFENKEVSVNFRNNRIDRLPILYTKKGKNESYDDMVDDVATSMLAFASMACDYHYMNAIIGELENAKYMASKRRVIQHSGKRMKRETVSDNDVFFYEPFAQPQDKSNMQDMLNDYFSMQVYHHPVADEGTFGSTRISKGKVARQINGITSVSQLGFNMTQRIANVSVGAANIFINADKDGRFTASDMAYAVKEYMKHSADRLTELGSINPDNYLSLFMEKHDIRQDNGRKNKRKGYSSKLLSKLFSSNLIFAGLTMGEDALAGVTAIAIGSHNKVLDDKGNERMYWEAFDKKYLDEENKAGAYLEFKKGWTNLDGSPLTDKDVREFTNKAAGANFDYQGIYNYDDKAPLEQYAFGALLIMYRKWMAPALKLRYGAGQYDSLTGEWVEGYYRTSLRFFVDFVKSVIDEGGKIATAYEVNWEKLTPYERANIHRAIREFSILTGAVGSIFMLEKLPPDDKDKDTKDWATSMLIYQLYRLRNELAAMAPTPLLIQEGMKILKTPFASLTLLKNALEVWKLFLPSSYTTTVNSGAYKGHSKAYSYFWNMPILSMRKQFDHFIDPSPMIQFYRNDVAFEY